MWCRASGLSEHKKEAEVHGRNWRLGMEAADEERGNTPEGLYFLEQGPQQPSNSDQMGSDVTGRTPEHKPKNVPVRKPASAGLGGERPATGNTDELQGSN